MECGKGVMKEKFRSKREKKRKEGGVREGK